jgi:HD superfamily phosphodiesterase
MGEMTIVTAEEMVRTDDEREALARLRELTGESGGAMERHGMRCFLIAEKLAAENHREIDREVMLIASLLHDIGLYDGASEGGAYVTDGRHYAERMLVDRGWRGDRLRRCLDAIELHHELRSQLATGAEAEMLRRADLIELSAGTVSFGLSRAWLRGLASAVPRKGIYVEVGRMVAKAARERPATLPLIFITGRDRDR